MIRLRLLLCAVLSACPGAACSVLAVEYSQLWGRHGELWHPDSRLPDFSYAGYHRGESSLPTVATVVDVTRFGADGSDADDDTEAFRKAIAATDRGTIFIPPGRYTISDIVEVRKGGIVLRGAGPEKSILYFPRDLEDVRPNMGQTTSGAADEQLFMVGRIPLGARQQQGQAFGKGDRASGAR